MGNHIQFFRERDVPDLVVVEVPTRALTGRPTGLAHAPVAFLRPDAKAFGAKETAMYGRRVLVALAILVGAFVFFVQSAKAQLDPQTDREWQAINGPGYHRTEIVQPPLPIGEDDGNYALRLLILPVTGERWAVIGTDFGQDELLTDFEAWAELTARSSVDVQVQVRYTNRQHEFRTDTYQLDNDWETTNMEFRSGEVEYVTRMELWFVVEGFDVGDTIEVDLDRLVYESTGAFGSRVVVDEFGTAPTGVAGEVPSFAGPATVLRQNVPNPFNPYTVIPFQLAEAGKVNLAVYSIAGPLVRVLFNGSLSAGSHTVQWDGNAASGSPVPSGVYLARLEAGGTIQTRKMLLVK